MAYRQFEFEYAGSRPEQVMMSITAHPRWGVPMRVRRRQRQQPSSSSQQQQQSLPQELQQPPGAAASS
jgi:hypothetical protein